MKILLTIALLLVAVSAQAGPFVPVNYVSTVGAQGPKGETGSVSLTIGSYLTDTDDWNIGSSQRNLISLDSAVYEYGITTIQGTGPHDGDTIVVSVDGVYCITASFQATKTDAGTDTFKAWIEVNGIAVPSSASDVGSTSAANPMLMTVNWVLELNAGDKVQFAWMSADTALQLEHIHPLGVAPAVPCIIATIFQIR